MCAYYGWAQKYVMNFCRIEPRNLEFFFNASVATRHYVAWAVRGYEKRASTAEEFEALARTIAMHSRREVIQTEWGFDPGKMRILTRLGSRVLPRAGYDDLSGVLSEPIRKKILHRTARVTPQLLRTISNCETTMLELVGPESLSKVGLDLMNYLMAGIRRLRPELTTSDLLARLRRGESGDVESWIVSLLSDMALPQAPWQGTDDIRPVLTAEDLKSIGSRFRNCLCYYGRILEAIRGRRVYYVCEGRPAAVACLAHDQLIDQWRLEELKGPLNRELTAARRQCIVREFEKAGYPYIPEEQLLGCSL